MLWASLTIQSSPAMAAFLNPPANPHSGTANPPFWNSLGRQRGQAFKKGDKSFRVMPEKANAKAPATVGGIERRIERDHGLPKGPVSLRNPTVGAEIARLPHLTLACKPFSWGLPLSAQ